MTPELKTLMDRVKANNRRLYETVGQSAPYIITILNKAETAVGFTPQDKKGKLL